MITQNIKYPYLKFAIDAAGILASAGIFILLINNIYTHLETNGSFEAGINVSGQNMTLLTAFIFLTVFCAAVSFTLKKIK